MTTKEAAKHYLQELKGKPLKTKVEYILTNYGLALSIFSIFLIIAVSYTIHLFSIKDSALNITCMGASATQKEADDFANAFAEFAGIDQEQYEVDISTNLSSYLQGGSDKSFEITEIMVALVAAREVDAVVSDKTTMLPYMYQRIFSDLTDILTPEQQARYKDCFLYADDSIIQKLKDMSVVEELPEFPDPTKPELMERPVPVAVRIPEQTEFFDLCFSGMKDIAAYGIVINSENLDNALAFLDYIMK